jgi:hypothetical protein
MKKEYQEREKRKVELFTNMHFMDRFDGRYGPVIRENRVVDMSNSHTNMAIVRSALSSRIALRSNWIPLPRQPKRTSDLTLGTACRIFCFWRYVVSG